MAPSTYEQARAAWAAGDAERALELCAGLRATDARAARTVILRARALLRLRRVRDAIALLEQPMAETSCDEDALAAMLLGVAYARGGDVDTGLKTIASAAERAVSPAVRSEIALSAALAHYQRRDFDAAAAALDDVGPGSGLVFARALECRGWIAKSRNDFAAAFGAFDAAFRELERCEPRDRLLQANLLATLSYIAIELLDFVRWDALAERAREVDWDSAGLSYHAFWFAMNRSMAEELRGRPRDALQAAREAASRAPTAAFRLFAECRRAAVLFAYGELLGFEDSAAAIRRELESVDVRLLHEFEEVNLPVVVAETLALIGDGAGAAASMAKLDTLSPVQLALLHDEPMKRAYAAYVEALVADANGDAFRAQHRYREALRAFDAIGMARRSLFAALRLAQLRGDADLVDPAFRTRSARSPRSRGCAARPRGSPPGASIRCSRR